MRPVWRDERAHVLTIPMIFALCAIGALLQCYSPTVTTFPSRSAGN